MSMDVGAATELLPQHAALIDGSAISPEVVAARGYRSVQVKAELKSLGFSEQQIRVPALLIPIWGAAGEVVLYQARPDLPRIKDGKAIKYETPTKARMAVDVPPTARARLGDPTVPLFVTEGVRKADAAVSQGLCCIALLGVWAWRGSNDLGGKVALPDWEWVTLSGRPVYIVFDSDVMTKAQVHEALARLRGFLEGRGAHVKLIYLPPGPGGGKVGLDDFLASGKTVDDLLRLATLHLAASPTEQEGDHLPYESSPDGIVWRKQTRDGDIAVLLTNFTARITANITEDDGAETRTLYEVEAALKSQSRTFRVPAGQFGGLNWAGEHLGAAAIVYPGFALRDHARAAIQLLSAEIAHRQVYAHFGWRRGAGEWIYLHAGGGLGGGGPVAGIEMLVPEGLEGFVLPAPARGEAVAAAVRASLRLLDVAPDAVTVPLFAAAPRVVLGSADFSLHLTGPTGVAKTELAVLAQQHWGPALIARALPGSWSSTGNALETLAFAAKDTLLVVDDFAPTGSTIDVQRFHREADRVLRAQGNRSGRQRLRADGTLRPSRPPRGLLVSTGEDVPRGQSLRARMLVLEVGPGAVDWSRLSGCQRDAAAGLYSQTLAAFISWLAPRLDDVHARMNGAIERLRPALARSAAHPRSRDSLLQLALGLDVFLAFAVDVDVLSAAEADLIWHRAWVALRVVGRIQGSHQTHADPVVHFLRLLTAALAAGRVHVATGAGEAPEVPAAWGWRHDPDGHWRPMGERVGWLEGDDLYLIPEATYGAAQRLGRDEGESLAVTLHTLKRHLRDRGLLASTDAGREVLTVRRTLEGARREVLHLHAKTLDLSSSLGPDQPDHEDLIPARGLLFPELLPRVAANPTTDPTIATSDPPDTAGCLVWLVGSRTGREAETRRPPQGCLDLPPAEGRHPTTRVVSPVCGDKDHLHPCAVCGGTIAWLTVTGTALCERCLPPDSQKLVARRIDLAGVVPGGDPRDA